MSGGLWEALAEWASMGRHGAHIWGAYLFCLLSLAALVAHAVACKRRALGDLREGAR